MSANTLLMYCVATLIWGCTWYAITLQLGTVDPSISVAYRFALAGALILGWCVLRGTAWLPRRAWPLVLGLAMTTFAANYYFTYRATGLLPSGLVAVAGSALSLMNVLNSRLFLGQPIRPTVLLGGAIGVTGVLLLFAPEVEDHGWGEGAMLGFALVMVANYCASLGNMAVAKFRGGGVPLVPATAWAMLIGAGATAVYALIKGTPFTFDPSPPYVLSLLFLALLGSVVAFLCYFTVLERIGADRAGYIAVMVPILALIISTLLEGYRWTPLGALGLLMAVGGNLLVMAPPGILRRVGPRPAA